MTDTMRCPSCNGAKTIMRLGGMMGDCNTCSGKGVILVADMPKPVIVEPIASPVADIIKAVNEASGFKHVLEHQEVREVLGKAMDETVKDKFTTEVLEPVVKVDPKKALYKRKSSN